jgi:hypothetical protein
VFPLPYFAEANRWIGEEDAWDNRVYREQLEEDLSPELEAAAIKF